MQKNITPTLFCDYFLKDKKSLVTFAEQSLCDAKNGSFSPITKYFRIFACLNLYVVECYFSLL